jgi:hypothetical protein
MPSSVAVARLPDRYTEALSTVSFIVDVKNLQAIAARGRSSLSDLERTGFAGICGRDESANSPSALHMIGGDRQERWVTAHSRQGFVPRNVAKVNT